MTENNKDNNKNIFVKILDWCKRSFLHPTTTENNQDNKEENIELKINLRVINLIKIFLLIIFFLLIYYLINLKVKKNIININDYRRDFSIVKLDNESFMFSGGNSPYIYIDNKIKKRKINQFKDIQTITNTAEIFYTISKTTEYTMPMNFRRRGHSSIVLEDGRVLIAGGSGFVYDKNKQEYNNYDFIPYIEIYNPKTKIWKKSQVKLQERLSGITSLEQMQDGSIFIYARGKYEIYNPNTDSLVKKGTCPYENSHLNTAHLIPDGRILICGSIYINDKNTSCIYYDSKTDEFSVGPNMVQDLLPAKKIILNNGNFLFIPDTKSISSTLQIYNIKENKFEYAGNLQKKRISPKAVLLPSGKVFFADGDIDSYRGLFIPFYKEKITCEIYHPDTKLSEYTTKCFSKRIDNNLLTDKNNIYAYYIKPYPEYELITRKGQIEVLKMEEFK